MPLRWAICAAGNISHDFACGISTLDPTQHTIVAVASRSLERAKQFAERHGIPISHGNYKEMAESGDYDVVYIGSVNSEHYPLCKLYLNEGKHVLCEKPLGLNVDQVRELTSLAKEKGVFLMEAVWSRFFPVYEKVREVLSDGSLGDVRLISASMGLPVLWKNHVAKQELGGGAIYATGFYALQLALMVFGDVPPCDIGSTGHLTSTGVDGCGNITLLFPEKAMAGFMYSGWSTLSNEAEIYCTKGKIRILRPFWAPTSLEIIHFPSGEVSRFDFPLPTSTLQTNFSNSVGLRYEAEAVRIAIEKGDREHELMGHEASTVLAETLEKIRHSLGCAVDPTRNDRM